MIVPIAVILAMQVAAVAPDTSLWGALNHAVDTSATIEGYVSLAGRTVRLDIARFQSLTGVALPGASVPGHWKSYDQDAPPKCDDPKQPCVAPGEIRVTIGGVKKAPDGSISIHGAIVYHQTPRVAKSGDRVPGGGSSKMRFRSFSVRLALINGSWKVLEAAAGEPA